MIGIASRIANLVPVKTARSKGGPDAARDLQGAGGAPPEVTMPLELVQPVLAVQMPSEPSVTRFYVALLVAIGELAHLLMAAAVAAKTIRSRMTLTNQKVAAGVGEVQMAESQMQEMIATFAQVAERMDGLNTTNQRQHTGRETLNAGILELAGCLDSL